MTYRDTNRPEYDDPNYLKVMREVKKRDKYSCKFPGCKTRGARRIQVHHIKKYAQYPALRQNPHNLICLCKKHHYQVRGKEEQFEQLFLSILIDKETHKKLQELKSEKIQNNSGQ